MKTGKQNILASKVTPLWIQAEQCGIPCRGIVAIYREFAIVQEGSFMVARSVTRTIRVQFSLRRLLARIG